ncbi:MAG TPA: CarD family transcriptional regulator [Bacillota bacterium]|nr:CarD family transcriptional regulator [Bacillota bacterium]HUM55561.1 CarD family transcriptional regulator [Bacillota bacterium]
MYSIGDKIVYPMHGAGIIEQIEEKVILGEKRKYYVLNVPCGDMKIMIPVEKSKDIGVRDVISSKDVDTVLEVLNAPSTEMSDNWNRRYRENMEKLKTGDICEVAEVVRNLLRIEREKNLSAGEKKMLANARQILVSEIILARDMETAKAEELVIDSI